MPKPLPLRSTFAPVAAFLCLTLLLVEAHEQVHALATRALCGGWAGRTFDNVLRYAGCGAGRLAVVDIAAPLFSYACLWLGAVLTGRVNLRTRALGFGLLFASLPLGRLLPQIVAAFVPGSTADEYAFVHRLAGDALGRGATGAVATALALMLTLPPLVVAWRRMPPQDRPRRFAAFYGLPLLFVIAWLAGANRLLADGALAGLGSAAWPGLVVVHAVLIGVSLLLLRKLAFDSAPRAAA